VGQACDEYNDVCAPCLVDSDCTDSVGCTDDACDAGVCRYTANNANCDDGLWCNGTETCDATNDCQAGVEPCTPIIETCNEDADTCDPADVDDDDDDDDDDDYDEVPPSDSENKDSYNGGSSGQCCGCSELFSRNYE
jgi:hypothetical protein